jgi:dGTPase
LGLNEYLAEAISLAHDLGHTPFGHAGEMALNELSPQGFHHQSQSLRVVEKLARHRSGLNLTLGVLDGIGKHSKGRGPVFIEGNGSPLTAEGQLVRAADIIAYLAHDLDDALEAGLLVQEDIPKDLLNIFGPTPSKRVEVMISDLLNNSSSSPVSFKPAFSKAMTSAMNELRDFLFVRVYRHPDLNVQLESGKAVIKLIYNSLMTDDALYDDSIPKIYQAGDRNEVVCDFISGMTDRFALQYAESLSCGLKPAVLTRLA